MQRPTKGLDSSSQAAEAFFRSAEAGRLAHAYLVVGRPELEGRAFARTVLAYLFCSGSPRPCGTCPGCLQVEQHRHPDVFWMEPESKSRRIVAGDEDHIGVRDMSRFLALSPFAGQWKACVILHADRMTESAANAFLKTLEEPSGNSLLLLLTDSPQALLPTIASRCQRIALAAGAAEARYPWQPSVADILKEGSAGEPLERMRLAGRLEQALESERERVQAELAEARGEEEGGAGREIFEARVEARVRAARAAILRFILHWHRDVLFSVLGVDESVLWNREHLGDIREQAGQMSYAQAVARLSAVEQMVRRLERNLPAEAVFEEGL